MLLHVSWVAWSDLNPSEKDEPLMVLSLHWDLIRVMQEPMRPKSDWRLGSPPHHICLERYYLGLGEG